uniref:Uncharacterized protein n=1 Tax=Micrurus lemniscatus lemniscatus TaxID=129467 RepID=A0A2D4HT37_MICLE
MHLNLEAWSSPSASELLGLLNGQGCPYQSRPPCLWELPKGWNQVAAIFTNTPCLPALPIQALGRDGNMSTPVSSGNKAFSGRSIARGQHFNLQRCSAMRKEQKQKM